jgi:hypothetical protein
MRDEIAKHSRSDRKAWTGNLHESQRFWQGHPDHSKEAHQIFVAATREHNHMSARHTEQWEAHHE